MHDHSNELITPISPNEKVTIHSISDLRDFVTTRQSYFLTMLRNFSWHTDSFNGLQRVSLDENGDVVKEERMGARIPSQENLHTGAEQCYYATMAVGVAIKRLANTHHLDITVETGEIPTNNHAENWSSGKVGTAIFKHIIGRVINNQTRQVEFYFDPTYAQIDHRYVGRMLFFEPNELHAYYQSQNKVTKFQPNQELEASTHEPWDSDFTIEDPEIFQKLIATIVPQTSE